MKRIAMSFKLRPQIQDRQWPYRSIRTADSEDLAILLYASFRGTIDDEGETHADARKEIDKTFKGEYGLWLPECSFVLEQGGFLASACLISWYEPSAAPFVVFTMTRPEYKGQGMARYLLKRSINALIAQGYSHLELLVTDGNTPAQTLYASLGFQEIPAV
ncbi:GNAT family N-acetyltransferase [Candidatus Bipolaricaulota bacterium]|nr:GNAT family N-acetyltransferase [Candidatus Bipolaricaulota bacterium]TFH08312.1 MAG: GNAT family N-acetyltransferase [Candidatus Atribacteria bacterium]